MEKLTITEAARTLLDLPPHPHPNSRTHLPPIPNPTPAHNHNPSNKENHHHPITASSLRSLLRADPLTELNRQRQQAEMRAWKGVKQELLRDMGERKEFLSGKAEVLARRMVGEGQNWQGGKNLSIEMGKARNYLSKIIKQFEASQQHHTKLQAQIKERMKSHL